MLERLQLEDLWIATGCLHQDPVALKLAETRVFDRLPGALRRSGRSLSDIEEELQVLRVKLFVGKDGRPPRVADYHGLGKLYSWVRMVAVRDSQNALRSQGREKLVEGEELWERLLPAGDSHLEYMKETYRQSFRHALAQAVDALEDRERLLLRQHFVEGVPSGKLASLYKVHRATVSRWIVLAQESLLEATRSRLRADLGIDEDELESVLRLIHSRFEASLANLLAD